MTSRAIRPRGRAWTIGVLAVASLGWWGPQAGAQAPTAKAVFAAGCFWCVEADFDKLPGVVATVSGFAGGTEKDPTYDKVSSGRTGYTEAVEVTYDPGRVSYQQLLDYYWHHVDPFTGDRQFCDVGRQYRPAIFYADAEQKRLADESKARIEAQFKRPVAVEVVQATAFYKAEAYHQDFYKKDPVRYYAYRLGCGRDNRLKHIWGTSGAK